MINLRQQIELFTLMGEMFTEEVECYAVGGNAMLHLGLKQATRDIDLVFLSERKRDTCIRALRGMGYQENSRLLRIYKSQDNAPKMFVRKSERFDLFLKKVIHFSFSKGMKQRVVETHEFGRNLVVHVISPTDLFLLKCATGRERDLTDANEILARYGIEWEVLLKEIFVQKAMGMERAMADLYDFLADLEQKFAIAIPPRIFSQLEKNTAKDLQRLIKSKSQNNTVELKNGRS